VHGREGRAPISARLLLIDVCRRDHATSTSAQRLSRLKSQSRASCHKWLQSAIENRPHTLHADWCEESGTPSASVLTLGHVPRHPRFERRQPRVHLGLLLCPGELAALHVKRLGIDENPHRHRCHVPLSRAAITCRRQVNAIEQKTKALDKFNSRNTFTGHEWIEAMVRIAIHRHINQKLGGQMSVASAVDALADHLLQHLPPEALQVAA